MGYPETLAEMSDIPTRTHRFYGEAKRLYEQEEGNVTLTTMQGLGVLWTWYVKISCWRFRRDANFEALLYFARKEMDGIIKGS